MPTNDNTLVAALRYACASWRVLPVHFPGPGGTCSCGSTTCKSAGKHPVISNWPEAATCGPARLSEWFEKSRETNIGVATGRGLAVIDSDGPEGEKSLAALEDKYGKPPPTATVLTGRGRHLYFSTPLDAKIRNRSGAGALAPGVDVRGEGGFVVAPPSLHANGNRYEWLVGQGPEAVTAAPAWLLELLCSKPEHASAPAPALNDGARFPKGKRHDAFVGFARRIRAGCKTYAEFEAALVGWGFERCEPPLKRAEAERQARDLYPRLEVDSNSLILTPAADIKPVPIHWLWPGRIARGKLSLLVGHPGVGKSQLALVLAATVSQGVELAGRFVVSPWPLAGPVRRR